MMNNDDTIFIIDRSTGRLVLTTVETHLTPGPKLPLWWHEPESNVAMTALCVWLAEHRALWPEWRAIAERKGVAAVSKEIARLWNPGIECCDSVMLTPGKDRRDITVSAILVTRNSVIGRHRFKTAAHSKAFMKWFLKNVSATSFFLLAEGCLVGPENLSRVMNAIADSELKSAQMRSGRSKPGRRLVEQPVAVAA